LLACVSGRDADDLRSNGKQGKPSYCPTFVACLFICLDMYCDNLEHGKGSDRIECSTHPSSEYTHK
jgi:hypothetical protein